jgi:hypothetical protein
VLATFCKSVQLKAFPSKSAAIVVLRIHRFLASFRSRVAAVSRTRLEPVRWNFRADGQGLVRREDAASSCPLTLLLVVDDLLADATAIRFRILKSPSNNSAPNALSALAVAVPPKRHRLASIRRSMEDGKRKRCGQLFRRQIGRVPLNGDRCAPAKHIKNLRSLTMISDDIVMTVVRVLGTLLFLSIGVLLGAVILRAAAKWAEKMDLPFWSSVGTVFIYSLASCAIGSVVALLVGEMGDGPRQRMLEGLVAPAGFLVQSAVISGRHKLSFGKGIKISIFMWLVTLLIGIAVAVVTIGVFSVMPRFG